MPRAAAKRFWIFMAKSGYQANKDTYCNTENWEWYDHLEMAKQEMNAIRKVYKWWEGNLLYSMSWMGWLYESIVGNAASAPATSLKPSSLLLLTSIGQCPHLCASFCRGLFFSKPQETALSRIMSSKPEISRKLTILGSSVQSLILWSRCANTHQVMYSPPYTNVSSMEWRSSCPHDRWLHNYLFPFLPPCSSAIVPCNSQITTCTESLSQTCFLGTKLWHPPSDLEVWVFVHKMHFLK